MRLPGKVFVLLSVSLMLSSCAAAPLPEFKVEQTERDIIPNASSLTGVEPGSTRFVGEVESADLYMTRGDGDILCLVEARPEASYNVFCGDGLGVGVELESGTRIELGTFRFPESQIGDGERAQLSESVTVITD